MTGTSWYYLLELQSNFVYGTEIQKEGGETRCGRLQFLLFHISKFRVYWLKRQYCSLDQTHWSAAWLQYKVYTNTVKPLMEILTRLTWPFSLFRQLIWKLHSLCASSIKIFRSSACSVLQSCNILWAWRHPLSFVSSPVWWITQECPSLCHI